MKQHSIKSPVSLEGIGLHTGIAATIKLNPAPANHGIRFKRIDLDSDATILADVNQVVSTDRATSISNGKIEVRTIEHLMSAIHGSGIDNLLVELDGPEVPIMNGHAKDFVLSLEKGEVTPLEKEKEFYQVTEMFEFVASNGISEYIILPSDNLNIITILDYGIEGELSQSASLQTMDDYKDQISGSRTFVFDRDLKSLYEKNLIKGGNIENALVLKSEGFDLSELKDHLSGEEIAILGNHLQNNKESNHTNEPARHKMLDLIGDLALLGKSVRAKIIAKNPGHTANLELTKHLKQLYSLQKRLKGKPIYNPNEDPIHDVEGIKKLLPHRYPFLLVDKIIELSESRVVGIKNITFNEFYFQGHFPGNPVFPGVLQMEALAQTGGILALSNVEKADEWDTYFIKMESVKFKYKVMPGDTLILKMELLSPIRRGIVHMQGTAYVGNRIVSEGELTAQIVHSRRTINE